MIEIVVPNNYLTINLFDLTFESQNAILVLICNYTFFILVT